jgi:hypothetical protein
MFPAKNALPAAVISRGATPGNHFTVYQIPAFARRQDGDVIPKRKKWQKRKRRRSVSASDVNQTILAGDEAAAKT